MEKTGNRFSVRQLAIIGLLSALVFVFSWVQVPVGDVGRVHLGNVFCALSGLLFGPLTGGLASGFGSMLFDFTNPLYIAESWVTFLTKFFIGFLAGLIAQRGEKRTLAKDVLGASAGSAAYVAYRASGGRRGAGAADHQGRYVADERGSGRSGFGAAGKGRAAGSAPRRRAEGLTRRSLRAVPVAACARSLE